ncbi:MAG: hypothetical protein KF729_23560 [Sandaracinaceae bacterium]|nr:hypothetical protein [Sandaracinaceae bacterium]
MSRLSSCLGAALVAGAALGAAPASADIDDWTEVPEFHPSPENFGIELRIGMYRPEGLGDEFFSGNYFGGDVGPHLSLQFHYYPFQVPYLGLFGIGASLGWSQWDTLRPGGGAVDTERNVFELLVLQPMVLWRFDTLAREVGIPIVLTPKIGWDFARWLTSPGTPANPSPAGLSMGFRFSGKVSLELDFIEPRAARQLDEAWGINHSELFVEFYYSMAGEILAGELPVSGWGWAAGLGFTF